MKTILRVPRALFEHVRSDLNRPHAFAFERVGFLYGRSARLADRWVVLLHEYVPVDDEHYLRDDTVGARIGSAAIRAALQRSLDHSSSAFHVHAHVGRRRPHFSGVDLCGLAQVMPPFVGVAANEVHGGLVLNECQASALVWLPGNAESESAQVRIVGFPMAICGDDTEVEHP